MIEDDTPYRNRYEDYPFLNRWLRRIIRITAIIIGAFILGLAYLSYKGWINVQWQVAEDQTKQMAYKASAQVLHIINDTASKFATSTTTHSSLAAVETMPISAEGVQIGKIYSEDAPNLGPHH